MPNCTGKRYENCRFTYSYTNIFPLIRESYAFICESFVLIRKSSAFIREKYKKNSLRKWAQWASVFFNCQTQYYPDRASAVLKNLLIELQRNSVVGTQIKPIFHRHLFHTWATLTNKICMCYIRPIFVGNGILKQDVKQQTNKPTFFASIHTWMLLNLLTNAGKGYCIRSREECAKNLDELISVEGRWVQIA